MSGGLRVSSEAARSAVSAAGFPERLGRYELLLPIGTGGTATVYLARAHGPAGFERLVALKMMHPHLQALPGGTAELIEEARLAARIRHANVVPVIDLDESPDGAFLVMDYAEGVALSSLVATAGEPIPRPIALRILSDALAGLHAAHELEDESGTSLGLVHRDFSPSNLLVGIDGCTRLTDFGIAKALSRTTLTLDGFVKGKIGYMSPEQARGRSIDRRTDVWAAGVIAWELFTGQRLFANADDTEILLRIVSGEPPPPSSANPLVPAALDEAILGALTSDVERRTPTAEILRRDLLGACDGQIAEPSEVAAFVARLAGPTLACRRLLAEETVTTSMVRRRLAQDQATQLTRAADGAPAHGTSPRRRPSRRLAWLLAGAAACAALLSRFAVSRVPSVPAEAASTPPSGASAATSRTSGASPGLVIAPEPATAAAASAPKPSQAASAKPRTPPRAPSPPLRPRGLTPINRPPVLARDPLSGP